jgi:hypothetical protein
VDAQCATRELHDFYIRNIEVLDAIRARLAAVARGADRSQ